MKFLVAAYVVAWAIHLSYWGWLARGYRKVREELKELER